MSGWASIEDALTVGYGVERSFCCHVHGDTNPSASVNSMTGLWICYTCGAKGKVDLETMQISITSVVREVNRVVENLQGPVHKTYPESWLSLYDATGPGDYWLSRFTPQACKAFRLGTSPDGSAATYPYRDTQGRLIGVVERSLQASGPKYKYPFGADTSRNLFNYHATSGDEIVITEGATDAIAAWECGYEAWALYGARLSYNQDRLIRRYAPKRLLVATDQDEAGHRVAKSIETAFPFLDVVRLRWHGAKDLASMSVDSRRDVLAQSREERVASPSCESSANRLHSAMRQSASSRPVRITRRLRIA